VTPLVIVVAIVGATATAFLAIRDPDEQDPAARRSAELGGIVITLLGVLATAVAVRLL